MVNICKSFTCVLSLLLISVCNTFADELVRESINEYGCRRSIIRHYADGNVLKRL